MPVIAEEEVDDDDTLRHPDTTNRPFTRHDSSSSSDPDLDLTPNNTNNTNTTNHRPSPAADDDDIFIDEEDDDGAYSTGSLTDSDPDSPSSPAHRRAPFSQHTFAPPFYGRPPTPLPPSPSLTSLLRPSRPTTPDVSDDDGAGGHAGSDLPRARPKVPTYEYYGFVLYLFSSLSFLIYLLWSYLPSPFLHALGIYYYPNRWWSLAIPSFIVMLLVYIYVALALYNVEILTLPMGSVETVVDEAAMVAVVDGRGRIVRGEREQGRERRRRKGERDRAGRERREGGARRGVEWREVWNEGTDAVMDVPLAGVCEVLYGEGREWDSEVEEGERGITRL
ncbi:PIG-P-domain-containing protein [Staphylotrichum tortipilum]|uniref:PIG-P-domain-containing protein n=1 Tax=Staphylotrichum tortipilum TaxID=2831512 RepID=A0AAN6MGR0_9PEZI|nr:PIG-P-domain-containing protein [Staphylotrichum longicolle]